MRSIEKHQHDSLASVYEKKCFHPTLIANLLGVFLRHLCRLDVQRNSAWRAAMSFDLLTVRLKLI